MPSDTISDFPTNFSDHLSLIKMDWLTALGRWILPTGYWGEAWQAVASNSTQSNKSLYLTFDDGPNPHTTRQLLDLLEEENVAATFFFVGSHVENHPEIVRLPQMKNHSIGSHSYSHLPLPFLRIKSIENEVVRTNMIIEQVFGIKPKLFRPPYGLIDQRAADCLNQHQMKLVYWGAVPEDWRMVGSQRVVARVAQRLAHGKIIVLHEGQNIAEQTIASTKDIIRHAKAQGYEFRAL